MHDNYVYFTNHVHLASFIVRSHCITPGQPFRTPDGSPALSNPHGVGFGIKAGRHGSKDTVNCVKGMFGYSRKVNPFFGKFTFENYGKYPRNFNFAVKGDLTIDGKTFDDVILAQGRSGARNNWWFGGLNCDNPNPAPDGFYYKEQVTCTATDGKKWCFTRGSTGNEVSTLPDHVKVEKKQC